MESEEEQGNETTVGSLLRASRLRREEDLHDVAQVLCIRFLYLEAIEEARYSDLPGNVYVIGFIRTYAEHLGLDSEEVVRRYKFEFSGDRGSSKLIFPSPISTNAAPGGAILFVGALFALIAYGSWYMGSSNDDILMDLVSPIPDRLSSMNGYAEKPSTEKKIDAGTKVIIPEAEVEPTISTDKSPVKLDPVAKQETKVSEPTPTSIIKELNVSGAPSSGMLKETVQSSTVVVNSKNKKAIKTIETDTPSIQKVVRTPIKEGRSEGGTLNSKSVVQPKPALNIITTPTKMEPAKEKVEESSSQDSAVSKPKETLKIEKPVISKSQVAVLTPTVSKARIIIRAKDDSWILIRDSNTNQLITRKLLRAGERYEVPGQSGLTLQAGNAGVLEITVDGKAVPSIGIAGAVLKNVALDADRLREGKAVVE